MKGCLRISDTSIKKIKSPFGDLLGSPGDGLPERLWKQFTSNLYTLVQPLQG